MRIEMVWNPLYQQWMCELRHDREVLVVYDRQQLRSQFGWDLTDAQGRVLPEGAEKIPPKPVL